MLTQRSWPDAYYQPDPSKDCQFYTTAYICRCLGYSDVTAQDVMTFRHTPRGEAGRFWSEAHYPEEVCGLEMLPYWRDMDEAHHFNDRWWLGPSQRAWVEQMLADGWIAYAHVMRSTVMSHAVTLLEARGDAGVFMMDPVHGPVVESWKWFLSSGPHHGNWCHRIEAWYQAPKG